MQREDFIPSSPNAIFGSLRLPSFVIIIYGLIQSVQYFVLSNTRIGTDYFLYGIYANPQANLISFSFGIWVAISLHKKQLNFADHLISTYIIGVFYGFIHIVSIVMVDDISILSEFVDILSLSLNYGTLSMIAGLVTWGILREIARDLFTNNELYPVPAKN